MEAYKQVNPYELQRYRIKGKSTFQNKDFPDDVGVYFIFKRTKLAYIGRSNNIRLRLAAHCANTFFREYMTAAYILIDETDLYDAEKFFIKNFNPPLNGRMFYGTLYTVLTKEENDFSQFRLKCKLLGEEITRQAWFEWQDANKKLTPKHYSWFLGEPA